jgi:hypothetical protein
MTYLLVAVVALAVLFRRPLFYFIGRAVGKSIGSQGAVASYDTEVVGESNYQRNLKRICGGKTRDGVEAFKTATLILEPENPHDENAVRIDIDGMTVGYLSRQEAIRWHRRRPPRSHQCSAVIRGGWERGGGDTGHFGVWLNLG